ncbi:MAG TPA: LOG family protein [Acidimicrobiia bacterium]|nr:LOG family protein [Acidimicrobiia bacterium]
MKTQPAVAIFGSSRTESGSPAWHEAEAAGARCARAGLTVVTGGYGGTMAAASKGAAEADGRVVGVTAAGLFRGRSGANPHVTHEIAANSITERIGILTDLASGALVLPGSIGTAAELVVAWNINHVARSHVGTRFPTVAIGEEWRLFHDLLTGRLSADGDDVHIADTTDGALDWLLDQPEMR